MSRRSRTRSLFSRSEPPAAASASGAYEHRAASRLSGVPLDTEYIDKRLTSLQAAYAPAGTSAHLGSPFHSRGPSPAPAAASVAPARPRSALSHFTELHPHDSASVAAFKVSRSGGTDRDGHSHSHSRSRSATPQPAYAHSRNSRSTSPSPPSPSGHEAYGEMVSPQPQAAVLGMSGMLMSTGAPDVDGHPRPASRSATPHLRAASAEPPHTVLSAAYSRPGAALQDLESMTTSGLSDFDAGALPATMGEHREQLLREQRARVEEDTRRVQAHDAHVEAGVEARIKATQDTQAQHQQLALAYDLADAVARLREAQEQLLVAQVRNSQYEMKVAQADGEKNKYKADLAVVASLLRRTRDDGKKSDEERRRLLRAFEETRLRLFKYHEEIKVRDARTEGREEGRAEAFEEAERLMQNKTAAAPVPLTSEQLAAHYYSLSPYGGGHTFQPGLMQPGWDPTPAQQFQHQVQSLNGQVAGQAPQLPQVSHHAPLAATMPQMMPQGGGYQQFAMPGPTPEQARAPPKEAAAGPTPTLLDMADDMARLAQTAQDLAAARTRAHTTPATDPIMPQAYPPNAPSLPRPNVPGTLDPHDVPLPPSLAATPAASLHPGSSSAYPPRGASLSAVKQRPQSMIVGTPSLGGGLGLGGGMSSLGLGPRPGSRAPSRASDLNKPLPLPSSLPVRARSRSFTGPPVVPHTHAPSVSKPENSLQAQDDCMLHAHIHQSRSNSQVDRYPVFVPSQPVAVAPSGIAASRPPTAHAHSDSLNTLRAAAATGLPPSHPESFVSHAPTVRSHKARSYIRDVMRSSDGEIDDGHLSRINEEPSPMPPRGGLPHGDTAHARAHTHPRPVSMSMPPSVPPPPRVPRSMHSAHSSAARSRRMTTVPSQLSYGARSHRSGTQSTAADPNLTAIGLGLSLHGNGSAHGTRKYDLPTGSLAYSAAAAASGGGGGGAIGAGASGAATRTPTRAPSRATHVSGTHTRSHSMAAHAVVHDDVRRAAAVPMPPSEAPTYATRTAYGYDRPQASVPPSAAAPPRSTRSTRTVDVAAARALPASRAPSTYGVTVETVPDAEAPRAPSARSARAKPAETGVALDPHPYAAAQHSAHLSPLPPSPARSHSSGASSPSANSARTTRTARSHPRRPLSRSRFPADTDDDLDPYPPSRPHSRDARDPHNARDVPLPPPGAGSTKKAY